MGSFCSCLCVEDSEEYVRPEDSIRRHCICLGCLSQQLINAYTALFQRGEVQAVPSSVQGATSLASAAILTDTILSDAYCSPPRPLPYDDPRCSRLQHGLVSRRDKSSSHLHEESEPLRSNNVTDVELKSRADKWSGSKFEVGSKLCCPESSLKHPLKEALSEKKYIFSSSEDEDVCPTCLEEYTSENPRIVMQCSHHFHLVCIYEWMERSEVCPVCGKVMVFNERT